MGVIFSDVDRIAHIEFMNEQLSTYEAETLARFLMTHYVHRVAIPNFERQVPQAVTVALVERLGYVRQSNHGDTAKRSTRYRNLRIVPPAADLSLTQDEQWCVVRLNGERREIRAHDYDELFSVPRLYQRLIDDILKCDSPTYMGDRLDLYSALVEISPATSQELADSTGLAERYVRERLSANAAGGYIEYDAATEQFTMTPEQAVIFAAEGHPHCMQGFFQAVVSAYLDEPKVTEVFRTGKGLPWSDHNGCQFCGTERFFRPMYAANLIDAWIPALEGGR